jgi:hypothetical protein
MRANLEAEQVNWLVHQSLRQRLTPYREPAVVRAYRTPWGGFVVRLIVTVLVWVSLYHVLIWGLQ